jgi:hypothetical protein
VFLLRHGAWPTHQQPTGECGSGCHSTKKTQDAKASQPRALLASSWHARCGVLVVSTVSEVILATSKEQGAISAVWNCIVLRGAYATQGQTQTTIALVPCGFFAVAMVMATAVAMCVFMRGCGVSVNCQGT